MSNHFENRSQTSHISEKEQIQQLVAEGEKQLEKLKYKFYIDYELYSISTIRKWQRKELIKTGKLLNRLFRRDIRLDSGMNFDEIKSSILVNKIAIGQDQLKEGLEHQIKMGQIISRICVFLSHGRHRVSVADIYLEDCKYDAREVMRRFVKMMTVNCTENQIMNFKANPNHFYSSGNNTTQEVVEMTGGTRFANRFFLKYGDDSGLST